MQYHEMMIAGGVLRQWFPAMNAILSCTLCMSETPEQTLERWRRVAPHWFYK